MKTSAYHFFLKHGGSSYTPATETRRQGRIRSAKTYAQAEQDARRFGLTFAWAEDWEADDSWMTPEDRRENPLPAESCVCRDPSGHVRAGLHGIFGATPEYRRVIEAELALEALASVSHA